ncbi:DUF1649-domain-containing protein [Stemphylium lycopersici]|uniref:Autophagy-related protein 101 n=1 Tax=Stemphylium lycopersici TaxID=183478 RepID=A0A364N425_STELY|nr:duf1649 domain-containing protein [Stemphylium lycopersici]RAR06725.1 DUF1649-domain-containing protein [Stemphylium lycopersici]RAR11440.1 DUF1649-domain-containing protein [Stemphylium lycopersici]
MAAAPSQFPSSCSSATAPHKPKSSASHRFQTRHFYTRPARDDNDSHFATPSAAPSPTRSRSAATRPPPNAARRTPGLPVHSLGTMEPRRRPEYNLDIFADAACVKDVVKAILHTIFFHRYFTSISPLTRDLLDLTLPAIDDVDLETLIEQKTFALVRAIDSTHQPRGRGQIVVQFFEKKRRKTYFFGKADEDVCWEQWTLDVTLAQPRTETDVLKVRRAMTKSLEKAAHKIIAIVNREKDHIPPITTTDANPFPYQIVVNPKSADNDWRPRIGLF